MEITNDNLFNIKYNSNFDKLEIRKKNKFVEKIIKHKVLSSMIIILIVFSCLNFFLIFNFIKVLESV